MIRPHCTALLALRLGLAAAALALAGCSLLPSHIHDEQRAETARALQKALGDYEKDAARVYELQLANLASFTAHEDALIGALGESRERAVLSDLLNLSFAQLNEQRDRVYNAVTVTAREAVIAASATSTSAPVGATLGALNESLGRAQRELAEARAAVTAWNATLALLHEGAASLTLTSKVDDDDAEETVPAAVEDFGKKVATVGERELTYLDAEGKTATAKIKDYLKDRFTVDEGKLKVNLPAAPGVRLRIAQLGVDLIMLHKKAAEMRVRQKARRLELCTGAMEQLALAEAILDFVTINSEKDGLYIALHRKVVESRVFRKQLEKLADEGDPTARENATTAATKELFTHLQGAAGWLADLRRLALAEGLAIRAEQGIKMGLARVRHEESLLESRIQDEVARTLLNAGAAALVVYHEGGLTPEDVGKMATIAMDVAQVVALGAIAWRVD